MQQPWRTYIITYLNGLACQRTGDPGKAAKGDHEEDTHLFKAGSRIVNPACLVVFLPFEDLFCLTFPLVADAPSKLVF